MWCPDSVLGKSEAWLPQGVEGALEALGTWVGSSPWVRKGQAPDMNSLPHSPLGTFSPVLSSYLPSMQAIPISYPGFPRFPGMLPSLVLFFLPGMCFSLTFHLLDLPWPWTSSQDTQMYAHLWPFLLLLIQNDFFSWTQFFQLKKIMAKHTEHKI